MDGSKPIHSHRSCSNLFGAHLPPPTSVIHRACAQQQPIPCRVLGDLRTIQERPQRYTRQTATSLHSLSKYCSSNLISPLLMIRGSGGVQLDLWSWCIGRTICEWPRSSWISEKHSSCMTLRRC